ncbi:hypothetical protein DLM78_14555 [Leptospira stimsonii]|uniref:Uncharacterized protein n=1 Tax=Leptospira stimsonii TaxID=2202203 RepID=A0A8B3CRW0_9LEPT|nr:hypothetical protein DLM78_14555 [Leptospira stimsonii]
MEEAGSREIFGKLSLAQKFFLIKEKFTEMRCRNSDNFSLKNRRTNWQLSFLEVRTRSFLDPGRGLWEILERLDSAQKFFFCKKNLGFLFFSSEEVLQMPFSRRTLSISSKPSFRKGTPEKQIEKRKTS